MKGGFGFKLVAGVTPVVVNEIARYLDTATPFIGAAGITISDFRDMELVKSMQTESIRFYDTSTTSEIKIYPDPGTAS